MGISDSELGKDRFMMNLHYFPLVFLLVITVNGAPKAAPNPKPDPKAKAQMAIIFNGGRGHTGQMKMVGRSFDDEYGFEQGIRDGWGFKGGYIWKNCKPCYPCPEIDGPFFWSDWCNTCKRKF